MEQINLKLFSLLIQTKGPSSAPQIYSKLRQLVLKYGAAAYHDKYSSEFDSNDERSGFSKSFNKQDYEDENEFGGRPRYSSNRSDYNGGERSYEENDHFRGRPSYNRGGGQNFRRSIFQKGDRFQMAGGQLSRPRWGDVELKAFKKNFYTPSEKVLNRSTEEIEEFRNANNLSLLGENIPNPIMEFEDHEFPPEVMRTFQEKGFEKPTPIQAQGWPIALSGTDFIGIGQTGSGKTLGYTVPGLVHIKHQPPVVDSEGPIGLVLAPTRELVQQIHGVSSDLFSASGLNTACVFGGANKNGQARELYQKPYFCIATPGRLLDFLEMGVTNLKRCTYLVLDEADRMLDMGFEPQIRKIISQVRPDRQTLMWSATCPREVERLASDFFQKDFIRLNVGSLELFANPNIEQEVEVCDLYDKRDRFITKMKEISNVHKKILVFAQTKLQVDNLSYSLDKAGISARGIHGDHSQNRRDGTLAGFRAGRFSVLVATDVASRGLDVDDITLVVNFDFPQSIEDYVHRIGRTARAGKSGNAYSMITDRDSEVAVRDLVKMWRKSNFEVPSELQEFISGTRSTKPMKKFRGVRDEFQNEDMEPRIPRRQFHVGDVFQNVDVEPKKTKRKFGDGVFNRN